MKQYDYVIVGSGLFAGVWAYLANKQGKKCLVIEKRDHLGGNIYCEDVEGIHVHKYGAHIFHTSNREVWDFVNSLAEFNRYTNSPVANYKGEMYNMPFNMNTFSKMWGISTPQEAKDIIASQRSSITGEPKNLEEQAISLVGVDIYQKLVKGYTEKQWGRDCKELPAFIIKRLPVRYTYDNNYFNDLYQGIPIGGYNVIIDKLFEGCDVETGDDWITVRREEPLSSVDIQTLPHPGFPTDLQAQFMLLAALADDVSVITENVFENRFMFAAELMRMGADVTLDDHHAIVRGVDHLEGAPVSSTDLRAGAALVLAGIVADGETSVHHLEHIDRGYEDYVGKLASLGADIRRVSADSLR